MCYAEVAVFSQHMIFLVDSLHAYYINLADMFTESPNTEYSLRDPLVPMTPANTVPVDIPMLHLQFKIPNSLINENPVKIALIGSS